MAVRFERVSGQYWQINSGLPAGTVDITFMGWARLINTHASNWSTFFGPTIGGKVLQVAVNNSASVVWAMWDGVGSSFGSAVSLNTWYHLALVKSGTSGVLYVNGSSDITQTWPNTGTSPIWCVSNYQGGADYWNGQMFAIKAWTAALSVAEIINEARVARPIRSDNLWGCWPTYTGARAADRSANGRNWTEVGSPTDEADPPIGWGAAPIFIPHFSPAGGGLDTRNKRASAYGSAIAPFLVPPLPDTSINIPDRQHLGGWIYRGWGSDVGGTQYPKSVDGTLTSSGLLVKQTNPFKSGTLTSSGLVVKQDFTSKSGTLTTAGATVKQPGKIVSGTLTSSGLLIKSSSKILAGVLSSSGSLAKQVGKFFSGTMSSAGGIIKQASKIFTGGLAESGTFSASKVSLLSADGFLDAVAGLASTKTSFPSLSGSLSSINGTLVKQVQKIFVGTLTSGGIFSSVKAALKSIDGTLTSAGLLLKSSLFGKSGSLSFAGSLLGSHNSFKSFTATLTSVGTLVKQAQKVLSGTITSGGVLTSVKSVLKSVDGTLTSSGLLINQTQKAFVGVFTSVGVLVKQVQKVLGGSLTSSGLLQPFIGYEVDVTGVLSSIGSLVNMAGKSFSGVLSEGGGLVKQINKVLIGTLTSSATLLRNRIAYKSLIATLTSSGAVAKQTVHIVSGVLASSATIIKQVLSRKSGTLLSSGLLIGSKQVYRSFTGVLTSIGSITLKTLRYKDISGILTSAGSLVNKVQINLSGVLSSVGDLLTFGGAQPLAGNIAGFLTKLSVPIALYVRKILFPSSYMVRVVGSIEIRSIPDGDVSLVGTPVGVVSVR